MRFSSWLFSLCASTLLLAACAREAPPAAAPVASAVTVPADQARPEERQQIETALGEIETIAAELGRPRGFHSLPVVLAADDDQTVTNRVAACVSENGIGQFIVIKRIALTREATAAELGMDSVLFRILLHEIGHCYFQRGHDDAYVEAEGKELLIDQPTRAGRRFPYRSLDASAMATNSLSLPIALKKYYVAELLGLARANSPEDFLAYAPVRMVPRR